MPQKQKRPRGRGRLLTCRRQRANPKPPGFNEEYATRRFKAGTVFYRAEAWNATMPGSFLGLEPTDPSIGWRPGVKPGDFWANGTRDVTSHTLG
jgi:hypothetical protein